MFLDDDNTPKNQPKKPKPLDKLSIGELEDYIREMKEEIIRVEQEIVRKKAHKDAVSSLFKS